MKRIAIVIAVIACLLLFSACDTTVTQHARNHRFSEGQAIEIISDENSELLGLLTITGAVVLSNTPFEVQLREVIDEDGQTRTVTETFRQIVQIYYTYTGDRRILNSHFTVRDRTGDAAQRPHSNDPWPVAFTPIPRGDEDSFVVALRNESSFIDIEYRFSMWQLRPTALVRVNLSGSAAPPPVPTTTAMVIATTAPVTVPTVPSIVTTTAPPITIEITETEPLLLAPVEPASPSPHGNGFFQGIAVGLAGAAVIAGLIIILTAKKRKSKEIPPNEP